jgi:hypothetical protein
MASIFTLENISDFSEKLNIDELYERKKTYDLNKLELYNKILNRIHVRIKNTARHKIDEQFCWYVVPEVIIGVPKYDHGLCIAYILDKLTNNGFAVRYIHPNTLFICWKHWVPSYVRSELKKKTGIVIDEFGKKLDEDDNNNNNNNNNKNFDKSYDGMGFNAKEPSNKKQESQKRFNPINSYKPQGIYNDSLINKLENKIN